MNETLRQVLAELPEIQRTLKAHLNDGTLITVTRKLCDALQAAADEIERLKSAGIKLSRDYNKLEESHYSQHKENQRLQAEIEQKNAALGIYADNSNWSSDWGWKGINDPTLIAKRELGGNQG